jgi:conjugative relaxase-like TrwC/TraI family protein
MLKIRVIRDVASRVDYHKAGIGLSDAEKTGHWLGGGVAAAGFAHDAGVSAEALAAALSGYALDGTYLGQRRKPNRRAGWDVVLSPHKSISVAALCLPDAIAAKVREAWESAVATTVTAMESLSCHVQHYNAGQTGIEATGNLIVPCFTHTDSRHKDPHLHTHCIVINATQNDAGVWRGLEPAPIYRNNMNLDAVLQHELHRELVARGLPSALDAKSRAALPVPAKICARLSTANRMLDRAMQPAQDSNIPTNLKAIKNTDTLRNLLNDRLRPPKRPRIKPFLEMLSDSERTNIIRTLASRPRSAPPRPPEPSTRELADRITADYHAKTLWPVVKHLFTALLNQVRKIPTLPFSAALRAIPFITHPGTRPQPPAAPQPSHPACGLRIRAAITRRDYSQHPSPSGYSPAPGKTSITRSPRSSLSMSFLNPSSMRQGRGLD